MNSKPPNRPERSPLSDSDERALDALIGEIQQWTPSPPDLTESILRQLAQQDWQRTQLGREAQTSHGALAAGWDRTKPRTSALGGGKQRRTLLLSIAGTLALAASVMLLLSGWERSPLKGKQVANVPKMPAGVGRKAADRRDIPAAQRGQLAHVGREPKAATTATSSELATSNPVREGVPLVRNVPISEGPRDGLTGSSPQPLRQAGEAVPREDQQLQARFDAAMASYWNRLGVTPAVPLSEAQWADRTRDRFGASPKFADEEDSGNVAARLVDRLMRDIPLIAGAREKMIEQATAAIMGGERFDELLSRWVADESLLDHRKPELLSQGLAANLLGVDAACARCHDSPVDGRFAQHDYWSLASVFLPAGRAPLFYELVDGRQQMAEVRLPDRWMGEAKVTEQRFGGDLKQQFAQSLVGNRAVAGSLANRLWEIGFDAPLVSPASDPMAPPRDDALQTSHELFTDAILASRFDLRVAVRWVMSSDAMRRGPSDLYLSGRWRVSSDEEIAKESLARRVFAAAPPSHSRVGRGDLITMMEARIGQRPRALEATEAVLAQPSVADGGVAKVDHSKQKPKAEEYLWAEWIADRELLRESWLHWIKDPQEQQRHALYAVNMRSGNSAEEFAKRLQSPGEDPSTAAVNANDRLFWVLRKTR